jgi:hypothetical protein
MSGARHMEVVRAVDDADQLHSLQRRQPGDDRSGVHRDPPATRRRVPTGRTEISGPSTSTVWFVC